jgi:Fe-S-cluster-containing hydrogenase component 2
MNKKSFKSINYNRADYGKDYIDSLKRSPGWPAKESFSKGPVAVIECIEEIPCNPCETVCPKNSIVVEYPITNLPRFNGICTGCGKCVAICPGLAIFIVDCTYSKTETAITIPYEFLPLPEVDGMVSALDRSGRIVCEARVVKVAENKKNNKTNLITIVVPKKFSEDVRFFKIQKEAGK